MYEKKEKKVIKYRKRFNPRHIKANASYTVEEIILLFGVSPNAISRWIKAGLKITDNQRPYLIFGRNLKEFISTKNRAHKKPCAENELFCCKCQKPRVPRNNIVQIKITPQRVNMKGVCSVCDTPVNKAISINKIEWYKTNLTVTEVVDEKDL